MELNLTYEDIVKTLREKSYINVPFSVDSERIIEAMDAFFRFLEEPSEIKEHIDFTIAPKHRRGDVGFKRRDPSDHIYNDSKEFFHFHPAVFERYSEFIAENPVLNDFLNKALPIWEAAYDTVSTVLHVFESGFPNVHNEVFATKDIHLLLRFLKYNWQSSGKYLAKPHCDAGSFTLAIAESCEGLRIGSHPGNLQTVVHGANQALFMLASNFRTVLNTDQFSAGWHDVIQVDDLLVGQPFARWALVAFIEAADVEALPRSETHKWYAAAINT